MSDDIERQMWEAFARCVPDEEIRLAVIARMIGRRTARDPGVVAARQALAAATPKELDVAFARAVKRGSFAPVDPLTSTSAQLDGRLEPKDPSGIDMTLEDLSPVFVVPLEARYRPEGHKSDRPANVGVSRRFRFVVPDELIGLGLSVQGEVEYDAGDLAVRIGAPNAGALPPIGVLAVGDGKVSELVLMQDGSTELSAVVPWDANGTPVDLIFGVLTQS